MCNDFGNHVAYAEFVEALRQAQLPIVLPQAPPNLEPRDDIWPTEIAPVIRRYGEGVEMARIVKRRPKGTPDRRPKGTPWHKV